MGARQKLNQAHLAGAGITSLVVGGLTGSLLIGGLLFAFLMLAGIKPESDIEQFTDLPVNLFDRLDLAVTAAINLAK